MFVKGRTLDSPADRVAGTSDHIQSHLSLEFHSEIIYDSFFVRDHSKKIKYIMSNKQQFAKVCASLCVRWHQCEFLCAYFIQ